MIIASAELLEFINSCSYRG